MAFMWSKDEFFSLNYTQNINGPNVGTLYSPAVDFRFTLTQTGPPHEFWYISFPICRRDRAETVGLMPPSDRLSSRTSHSSRSRPSPPPPGLAITAKPILNMHLATRTSHSFFMTSGTKCINDAWHWQFRTLSSSSTDRLRRLYSQSSNSRTGRPRNNTPGMQRDKLSQKDQPGMQGMDWVQ